METLIQEYDYVRAHGGTEDEVLRLMHKRGLTIAEAIKTFMKVYRVPLGEAKEKVAASPFWREIVEAAEPLHNQVAESHHENASPN